MAVTEDWFSGDIVDCWLSAQMGQKVNGDFELILRAL